MALFQMNRTITLTLITNVVTIIQCLTIINGFRIFNKDPVLSLYFRIDNIDPVIANDGSFLIGPNFIKWATNLPDSANPEIRLITSGVGLIVTVEGDFSS